MPLKSLGAGVLGRMAYVSHITMWVEYFRDKSQIKEL